MFKRIKEPTVLFISILKWVVLATVIGVIVGLSTAVFLKILNGSIALTSQYPFYFLSLPAALFLSSILVKYLAPEAGGRGTEKVIEAVHKQSGNIKALVIEVLKIGEKISRVIQIWSPLKGLIGGFFLIGLALIFSRRYLGLGLNSIEYFLQGGKADWFDFILKMVFTYS